MKIGTTRVETFSDGVIAIVITVMVLALKIPALDRDYSTSTLMRQFHELLPYFIAYAFSFMMIGIFWTNHHHMFHLLERADEHLLWQNLLFLFWISLIPFSTAMVGAHPGQQTVVALYGFIMLMSTLSFTIMRSYSIRKKLVHQDEDQELNRKITFISKRARTKSYIGTAAYLVSIPAAFVHVNLAYFCFIVPPILFFMPDGIDDERLSEKVAEKNRS